MSSVWKIKLVKESTLRSCPNIKVYRALLIESKYVEPFVSIRESRKFLLDDEKFFTKARWFLGNPFLKVFALAKSKVSESPNREGRNRICCRVYFEH